MKQIQSPITALIVKRDEYTREIDRQEELLTNPSLTLYDETGLITGVTSMKDVVKKYQIALNILRKEPRLNNV